MTITKPMTPEKFLEAEAASSQGEWKAWGPWNSEHDDEYVSVQSECKHGEIPRFFVCDMPGVDDAKEGSVLLTKADAIAVAMSHNYMRRLGELWQISLKIQNHSLIKSTLEDRVLTAPMKGSLWELFAQQKAVLERLNQSEETNG